ncbi:peptide ligase PGM1-related protein [Streptomyces sp. NPDC058108]|uniref:preATP grasp domain-containing protein n=1 Tax=Streptomyces sp. NPDC058108 TaxID=3346344 RepID=UPI0036E80C50
MIEQSGSGYQGKPLILFANFHSDLAVDFGESEVLAQWAQQAPREVWLLQAGDVLVSPVPLAEEFLEYAANLTGVPAASLTVVEVRVAGGSAVPMADAVRQTGLVGRLHDLAGEQSPPILPTALDRSVAELARELDVSVHPYATVSDAEAALDVTTLLNTKSGFRQAAEHLRMRVSAGRTCHRAEVDGVVRALLEGHERVVVKPDRSAGGHGLRFVSRGDEECRTGADLKLDAVGGPTGMWVVEEFVDVAQSVSVQLENTAEGTRVLFDGTMETSQGSYTGYRSPLPRPCAHADELERWGTRLGRYLAERGYAGPLGFDALVSKDGKLYASESNVRRTATTSPHAMVMRLTAVSPLLRPAWSVSRGRTRHPLPFREALDRVRDHRLAFDPAHGEGVVFYQGAPPDARSWRYAVIAADLDGLSELDARLAEALEFEAA